jgi:hypothetical protein
MLRVMMNTPSDHDMEFDGPSVYRIRVRGRVSANWSGRLGGMAVTVYSADTGPWVTSLLGELSDQADLVGVLNTLYGLHLPVLSVECLNAIP